MPEPSASPPDPGWLPREPASAYTHLLGAGGSAAAMGPLVWRAAEAGQTRHVVSLAVFGAALVLTYAASTLYHWVRLSERAVERLRRFDRLMIYVLIAATYLPVCLGPLAGAWGWSILATVAGLGVLGILTQVRWPEAPHWLSTLTYVCAGWVAVAAIGPLVERVEPAGLSLLGGGGLSYTAGAIVLMLRRPHPADWFGHHDVFHCFVLGGSACHILYMQQHLLG